MNLNSFKSSFKKLWWIGFFIVQPAAAILCRDGFYNDNLRPATMTLISSYDVKALAIDTLGPFRVEAFLHQIDQLLGPTKHVQKIRVEIRLNNSSSVPRYDSEKLILRTGSEFRGKFLSISEQAQIVSRAYGRQWIQLNLPGASADVKDFFAEAITLTFLGSRAFPLQLSPMGELFWYELSRALERKDTFRTSIIPNLLATLKKLNENPTSEDLVEAFKTVFTLSN
jgi:hypothetical protein